MQLVATSFGIFFCTEPLKEYEVLELKKTTDQLIITSAVLRILYPKN